MRHAEYQNFENIVNPERDPQSETRKFIESIKDIVEFVRSQDINNVIFLDKKGRIAAAFFNEIWKHGNFEKNLPNVNFLNAHNTKRYKVPGHEDLKNQAVNIDNYKSILNNNADIISRGTKKLGMDEETLKSTATELIQGLKKEFQKEYPALSKALQAGEKVLIVDEIINTGGSLKMCKDILSLIASEDQIKTGAVWAYGDDQFHRKIEVDIVGQYRPDIPFPKDNVQLDPIFSFLGIRTTEEKLEKLGIADTPSEYVDERDKDFNPEGFQSTVYPSARVGEFRQEIKDVIDNYYNQEI